MDWEKWAIQLFSVGKNANLLIHDLWICNTYVSKLQRSWVSWLFILCLKLGEPSSILLHDVPVCECCSQAEPVWSVNAMHVCSSLDASGGFINESWTQRKKVVVFFQVTQLVLCLVLNFPSCCFPLIYNLTFQYCRKRFYVFIDRKPSFPS